MRTPRSFAPAPRGVVLVALLALLVGGCAESNCPFLNPWHSKYHWVHIADPRGKKVADYIAEGPIHRTFEGGYEFHALERFTAPPYSEDIRYPYGRKVAVDGPNIIIRPCGQPLWYYEGRTDYK